MVLPLGIPRWEYHGSECSASSSRSTRELVHVQNNFSAGAPYFTRASITKSGRRFRGVGKIIDFPVFALSKLGSRRKLVCGVLITVLSSCALINKSN